MASSAWKINVGVNIDTSDINSQLKKATQNAKVNLDTTQATKNVQQLGNSVEDALITFNVANNIFTKSVNIIKSMASQVYALDSALTEFRKVSDLSGKALDQYVEKLDKMGESVGRSASSMVEAAGQFRKSGFTDEESANLAMVASLFQNVADTEITAADAAASITSQIRAFGLEASDAIHIIDAYNQVANNFSVGTNDLSAAMEVASAGMATYGNSFEQILGLVASGSEILTGKSLQVSRG